MPIDAYNNYGERFCQVFKWSFSWGGKFFEPDMAWYNVLLNKNRLAKMADLGIIFLRRKHHPLIPVIIYSYYRKYAVPLFLGHPVFLLFLINVTQINFENIKRKIQRIISDSYFPRDLMLMLERPLSHYWTSPLNWLDCVECFFVP